MNKFLFKNMYWLYFILADKPKCPNCKVEYESAHISDAYAGDVMISASVVYCPKCLYVYDSDVKLSK